MKKTHYLLFLLMVVLCSLYACKKGNQPTTVSVMSYNIRYDNPADSMNSWDYRKEQLVNEVLFYDPDFMGIQEGLAHQIDYLSQHLTHRKFIGVGRKDGKRQGEYSAIFYNAKKYDLVSGTDSTMWLSKTPEKPSVGWDAALPRIVTFGKFKSKETGQEVYVFNTHFDHRGDTARANSAKLILETIRNIAEDVPVVLTGDFNVTDQQKPYQIIESSFMEDAWVSSKLSPVGPEFTFSGFDVCGSGYGSRIDYIFVNKYFEVNKIATISNFRAEHFLSDHLPIFSVLTILSK